MKLAVLLGFLMMLTFATNVHAQDSTRRRPDSTVRKPVPLENDSEGVFKDSARLALEAMPRKAVWRSAIVPGLGQIYNKRIWKVPLVYGGYATAGVIFVYNNKYYKIFLEEAQYRQANNKPSNPDYATLSTDGIIRIKDAYRRDRDFAILLAVGWHAVQMIDAYIDAKFFRFDIGDELGFKVRPALIQGIPQQTNAYAGLSLKFKL